MTPEEIKKQKKTLDKGLENLHKKRDNLDEDLIKVRAHIWRLQHLMCGHLNFKERKYRGWQWKHCPDCELDFGHNYPE